MLEGPAAERHLFKRRLAYLREEFRVTPDFPLSGIEIGVLNGETSAYLCSLNVFLLGIDPIIPDSMEASLIGSEEKIWENTKEYPGRFILEKKYSHEVAHTIADNQADFVFIDGSHHYDDVVQDYKLYLPKVKPGGLIFLHDSRMNRGGPPFHVGPSKFADEIITMDDRVELIDEAFSMTCFRKKEECNTNT